VPDGGKGVRNSQKKKGRGGGNLKSTELVKIGPTRGAFWEKKKKQGCTGKNGHGKKRGMRKKKPQKLMKKKKPKEERGHWGVKGKLVERGNWK